MNNSTAIRVRTNFIKAMNSVMYMINDDKAYNEFRSIIPFCNSQVDAIRGIAASPDDTVFSNAVDCFNRIVRDHDFFADITGLKDKSNAEFLKGMHTLVCHMNDESAYYLHWTYIIPDDANDEELEYIAENDDETFNDATDCFKRCVKRYACKSGYCIMTINQEGFGEKEYGSIEEYEDDDDE